MSLKEKIELFGLSEKETNKILDGRFSASLSLYTKEELIDVLEILKENGINISNAKDIKVYTMSVPEVTKNIGMLKEDGELDLYKSDPSMLPNNVIELHRRMKQCKQNNIEYKYLDENGNYIYEDFIKIKNETEFQDELNKRIGNIKNETDIVLEENPENMSENEPEMDLDRFSFNENFWNNNTLKEPESDLTLETEEDKKDYFVSIDKPKMDEESEEKNNIFHEVNDLSNDLNSYIDQNEGETNSFDSFQEKEQDITNPLDEWERNIGEQLNRLDNAKSDLGFYDIDFDINNFDQELGGRGGRAA